MLQLGILGVIILAALLTLGLYLDAHEKHPTCPAGYGYVERQDICAKGVIAPVWK